MLTDSVNMEHMKNAIVRFNHLYLQCNARHKKVTTDIASNKAFKICKISLNVQLQSFHMCNGKEKMLKYLVTLSEATFNLDFFKFSSTILILSG